MNSLPSHAPAPGALPPASFRSRLRGFLKKAASAPDDARYLSHATAASASAPAEARIEVKPAAKTWMADGYLDSFSDQDKLVIRRIHQQLVRLSVFDDMTEEEKAVSTSANKVLKDALSRSDDSSLLSAEQRVELFAELRQNLTAALASLDRHVQLKFAGTPHFQR